MTIEFCCEKMANAFLIDEITVGEKEVGVMSVFRNEWYGEDNNWQPIDECPFCHKPITIRKDGDASGPG